jgi:nucleoside-diphosphate-sugar epimerase
VLVAGCGYVGVELGRRLRADGHQVYGLRRRAAGLPPELFGLEADLTEKSSLLRSLPGELDLVVYAASAGETSEKAYRAAYVTGLRNLLEVLAERREEPRRLLFVSSTGVYAQDSGEWVDEESPAEPTHFTGKILLEGERIARGSCASTVVVRFGGIYGPGRTGTIDRVRSGDAVCPETPLYGNRIHRDDCAGVLHHLGFLPDPAPLYLGVDDEPADLCAVYCWIAARLGLPPPRRSSEAARLRYGRRSNKRCRNRLLRSCGYVFRYPTFREGYGALL